MSHTIRQAVTLAAFLLNFFWNTIQELTLYKTFRRWSFVNKLRSRVRELIEVYGYGSIGPEPFENIAELIDQAITETEIYTGMRYRELGSSYRGIIEDLRAEYYDEYEEDEEEPEDEYGELAVRTGTANVVLDPFCNTSSHVIILGHDGNTGEEVRYCHYISNDPHSVELNHVLKLHGFLDDDDHIENYESEDDEVHLENPDTGESLSVIWNTTDDLTGEPLQAYLELTLDSDYDEVTGRPDWTAGDEPDSGETRAIAFIFHHTEDGKRMPMSLFDADALTDPEALFSVVSFDANEESLYYTPESAESLSESSAAVPVAAVQGLSNVLKAVAIAEGFSGDIDITPQLDSIVNEMIEDVEGKLFADVETPRRLLVSESDEAVSVMLRFSTTDDRIGEVLDILSPMEGVEEGDESSEEGSDEDA